MPNAEIEVRRATERDIEPVARVQVEAWRSAYRGLIPDAVIEARGLEERKQRWTQVISQPAHDLLVAVRADRVIGFCSLIPSRDAGATKETGEIAALYVAPEHWRTGAGRQLMRAGGQAARERGYRELTLWVLSSNTRARAFYESMGLVSDGAEKLERSNGHALHELRYRRSLDAE
jgi:ribosomal protein S18 acetylase RimI-like enzyme